MCLAVADVHVAARPWEVHMKSEPLNEPAALPFFELNFEFKARAGGEFRFRTGELSLNAVKTLQRTIPNG